MNIVLIGCGLIGGSIVLDLRKAGRVSTVVGIETNQKHLTEAIRSGLIDRAGSMDDIQQSDVVILATPVDVALDLISEVMDHLGAHTVVMDVGSTKGKLCNLVDLHAKRNQFVATHPIAGTEFSGPSAAFSGLYREKIALICGSNKSGKHALDLVQSIYEDCGSTIIEMDPIEHDRHLAYVSHLSHVSSFTLGLTVLDIEKEEKNISLLAGSGFESTVRLAKSSPEMWEPIFLQNSKDLKKALDEYILHLQDFRKMIDNADGIALKKQMKRANSITQIIKKYQ